MQLKKVWQKEIDQQVRRKCGEKNTGKKKIGGKQKHTKAVIQGSQTEGIGHRKKEELLGWRNDREHKKAQSMVQALFIAGGSLNCFKKNQDSQTRVWGRGEAVKKKKKAPGKLKQKKPRTFISAAPYPTKTRDRATDPAVFLDGQTGLV